MKSFELLPTEENLIKALQDDLLKRNKDLVYFYKLLLAQEVSTSIAIDGRWGSGKTFFVKQTMLFINARNPLSDMDENNRNGILSSVTLPREIEENSENCELAVYYDAWENDNDIDPVLSIVYEIVKQLGINPNFSDNGKVFKLAASILEAFTGKNINSVIDNLKSENPITKIKEQKDLNDNIKEFFSKLLEERGNRLIVIIDELDRCKPSYAVQLLERIKHYLCDDRITFVYSVNLEELQHTIKHYYGHTFDACRYLDRFFDMRISLPPADKTAFYGKMGLNSNYVLEEVSRKVIEAYNMELREASRFYYQVKIAVYEPTHESRKHNFYFSEGRSYQILLMYIVPLIIGLKIVDISLYNEFMDGKNSKPIMDVYKNSKEGQSLVEMLLNNNETFEESEGKKVITIEQKLQELYDAIFVTEYTNGKYFTILGDCHFDSSSKKFLMNVQSMLSMYADYEV